MVPAGLAGYVALEAAADFPGGLSFRGAPGDVGAGAGQLRIWVTAVARLARLRARSPPRPCRCRMVWPLLAGIGLVPPGAANAASLRRRPGWEKLTMACAALTGPIP